MASGHPVRVVKWKRKKPWGAGLCKEDEVLTQAMDLRAPIEKEGETEERG